MAVSSEGAQFCRRLCMGVWAMRTVRIPRWANAVARKTRSTRNCTFDSLLISRHCYLEGNKLLLRALTNNTLRLVPTNYSSSLW